MRRVHILLQHMANIVVTCIMLYDMCVIKKNKFNMELMEKTER